MKFTPSRNTVISTATSKKFSFEVNAKSFSILTSGIYQNKIKAVIREYSTNALDSHLEANNPEPFEVHLPTEKECYFYVRDYGTGLTKKELEDIYFSVFTSTKDNNNDFNGCLGLGNLSGLSYNTKSFSVESWKGGYHYIYSCCIGQSGVPEFSQLHKEYSQDPEGIKVQIAVDPDDIDEFEEEAKEVYKFFKRQPKFIGKEIELENIYTLGNDIYAINPSRRCLAVMGNVAYPITKNYILDKYKNLLDSNIILFFDIGELTFTPSRESLEYTDYTIKNIKAKFDKVLEKIDKDIIDQITSKQTEFEAIAAYNYLRVLYQRNIKGISTPDKFTWNNKELSTKEIDLNCEYFNTYNKRRFLYNKLLINNSYKYVVNDLKIGAISRCREIASSGTSVYLINQDQLVNFKITYPEFTLASSLPRPPKNNHKRCSLGFLRQMVNNHYVTHSWKEDNIDVDKITSKYYIIRDRYRVIFNGKSYKPKEVFRFMSEAKISVDVYGVKKEDEEKVKKLGFVNIEDVFKEKQEKMIQELDKNKYLFLKLNQYNVFCNVNERFFSNLMAIQKKFDIKDSECLNLLKVKQFLKLHPKKLNNFLDKQDSLRTMGYKYELPERDYVKKHKDIMQKFKLLSSYSPPEDLYFYILGVDYANASRNV